MLLLKACPRCRGDLIVEQDRYGPVIDCLQCGYEGELRTLRRWVAAPMVIRAEPEPEAVEAP